MKFSPQLITKVLTAFLAIAQKDSNKFDKRDIENLNKTNHWRVERYVLIHKTEEDALKALTTAMEWRKSFGVNDIDEKSVKDIKPGKICSKYLQESFNNPHGHFDRNVHCRGKGQKGTTAFLVQT